MSGERVERRLAAIMAGDIAGYSRLMGVDEEGTLRDLKERNIWLVGLAGEADQSLYEMDLKGPLALVMGAEGDGMRRLTKEHCDFLAKLPMTGTVESLNVSVATGIALFEAVRQRVAPKK